MHVPIYYEAKFFLEAHRDLTAKDLAISAGIHPTILTKVLTEKRHDMWSSNADNLRYAMRRLERELTPTASAETPNEPEEVNHELA